MRDKRYISFIKEIILFLLIKMYVTLVTQKISANFPHSTVVTHEEKNVTLSFFSLALQVYIPIYFSYASQ